jgi:hypothetical protein
MVQKFRPGGPVKNGGAVENFASAHLVIILAWKSAHAGRDGDRKLDPNT